MMNWKLIGLFIYGTFQIGLITGQAWAAAHEYAGLSGLISGVIAVMFGLSIYWLKEGGWKRITTYALGAALGGWLGPIIMPWVCN